MPRSTLAAVGVALLAATAGCGGFLESTATDRGAYGVPSPTPSPTPTATATPELAPAGIGPQLRSQASRLRAAGNYTLVQTRNATRPQSRVSLVNRTVRVDVAGDRILVRNHYEFSRGYREARQTFYQEGRRIWDRLNRSNEPVAFRNWTSETPGSAVESSIETLDSLGESLASVPLEPAGTAVFEGERMVRFTASDPDSAVLSTRSAKHHYLTVLIDDRGVVRYVEETVVRDDSGRVVRTVRIEVHDLGTTTVRRPGWVGNATGPQGGERVSATGRQS